MKLKHFCIFEINCISLTIETTCGDVKHSNLATSVALSCTITSCFRVTDGRNNILFVISVCTYNFASGVNFWGENYKKIIILLAKKN